MTIVQSVSLRDHGLIETPLIGAGLVTADQDDGIALGIEGKERTVLMVAMPGTQLLHLLMTGALDVIDIRSPQVWADSFQNTDVLGDGQSVITRQGIEPSFELRGQENRPCHACNIPSRSCLASPDLEGAP